MTDIILSILALAGFGLFLFILGYWAPQPDLIVVLAIGAGLATYDFIRSAGKGN